MQILERRRSWLIVMMLIWVYRKESGMNDRCISMLSLSCDDVQLSETILDPASLALLKSLTHLRLKMLVCYSIVSQCKLHGLKVPERLTPLLQTFVTHYKVSKEQRTSITYGSRISVLKGQLWS